MKDLKIKVCGMKEAANIAAVAELAPAYMGFIFYKPSPRYISDISAELIKYIPSDINTVGVFVNEDINEVKLRIARHQLKAVQLHGTESIDYCAALKTLGVAVIKAFGIHSAFDFKQLELYEPVVDNFLFDTQTPIHGGSGKVFNWQLLEKYKLDKSFFLSGGIGLEHTRQIIEIQDPRLYAIDVNSKFELEPGLKDIERLKSFFEELN